MTQADKSSTNAKNKRVCLGAIAGAHGVKGAFKVKTFTEDERDLVAYGPLETEDGKHQFNLKIIRVLKPGLVLVSCPSITSPEQAKTFSTVKLYVDRDRLPDIEEENAFYHEDLIGLVAFTEKGASAGRVKAVLNFGAGDILELVGAAGIKGSALVPFTQEAVPAIDLFKRQITVTEEALQGGTGNPEKGEAANETDLSGHEIIVNDETGEIVSDNPGVNLAAMREEDA